MEAGVRVANANVFAAEFERLGVRTMLSAAEAKGLIMDGNAVAGVKVEGLTPPKSCVRRPWCWPSAYFGGGAQYCDQLVSAINEMRSSTWAAL